MNARLSIATVVLGLSIATIAWAAQQPASQPASRQREPLALVEACVRRLIDEAKQSMAAGALLRTQPTFAREFAESLPPAMLVERVLRPQHDDAFIDAYVRWQLTGFQPPVGELELNAREFARLVDGLPSPRENPRADESLLQLLNRTVQKGPLNAAQQQQVNSLLNELATTTSKTAAMNVPAMQLRAWMIDQFRAQSHRCAALHLEHVASMAKAGWPGELEQAKTKLIEALQEMSRDRAFSPDQRREFLDHAARAITTGRVAVASAGLAADALAVEYVSVAVFDFDVRRWEALLREQ